MSKTSDRSEQRPASGEKVPGWTPEVGTRLALIIERFGGLKPAAEFLDTKAETIASWRDGKTRAPLFSVQALAEKTGFSLDWLMRGDASPAELDVPEAHDRAVGWTPDLGRRLKSMIEELGGPKEAATLVGVTPEQLSKWRDGKARASFAGVAALAKASKHSLDWVLSGQEANGPDGGGRLELDSTLDAQPTPFDEGFVGQVGEMVEHLYRKEGMRPSARELVQVSTRIYAQVCAATADPIDRLGVLKTLLDQERAALRDAAARKPGSRKSTV